MRLFYVGGLEAVSRSWGRRRGGADTFLRDVHEGLVEQRGGSTRVQEHEAFFGVLAGHGTGVS